MNPSALFIRRYVATTLLTAAIILSGAVAFKFLPIAALPQVDFPTISVQAQLPGASPEIMASSVATPLERSLGLIAGVDEMTSSSYLGTTTITLQFDLNRDINGAARDVEAAINSARSYLPANLPANPSYKKVNPADAPILILALTSKRYDSGTLYDAASTIIQQKLSQIQGVGQVNVGGSSLPAVRVEVNPTALNSYGLGMTDLTAVLRVQNSNLPKGQILDEGRSFDILTNDQLSKAAQYRDLVVAYRNGAAVRLSDVAEVKDSIQSVRTAGYLNGNPSVLVIIFRSPGANIIDTVDHIRRSLPALKASVPSGIDLTVVLDRTTMIKQSVKDVERTLLIAIGLVIFVVFAFLRNVRATLIPSVAVPTSLIGTFGVMYLMGYSLDNLSLMALTISTGFVVDDAIVVIENITRYLEKGMTPIQAALKGASEIGFTVLSISLSLIAVFIPILMMGGIVGRLFREFAVTLSVAILVSLFVSLTATPMMCARLLKRDKPEGNRFFQASEKFFAGMLKLYERSLKAVLRHRALTLVILLITIAVNGILFVKMKKGFFPEQDNGTVFGGIQGSQDISFYAMDKLTREFVQMIRSDPAVKNVMAFLGGSGSSNSGFMYLGLKPLEERKISASEVISRLRPKLMSLPGASVFLQAGQDVRIGGRMSNAQYQYTIQTENIDDLVKWGPRLLKEMKGLSGFTDVNSDQLNDGLRVALTYDRPTASRVGVTPQLIDNTLYQAYGQSLASTIYTSLNQYFVVLEVAPKFSQNPQEMGEIYLHSPTGGIVPLNAVTREESTHAPLAVNHQGQYPSVTVSFNLAPGVALSDASQEIAEMEQKIGMPSSIRGMFSGTLEAFQRSLSSEPLLILLALLAVYIVLGVLYESYIHPITILSTIPSAGVGAVLALMLFRMDLSVVALIGIILLIGIVKKNAILMIDFAIAAERGEGKSPESAIFEACILRFRPILMTTMAALFGALPLAFGSGAGSELRRPMGVAIVGGLIFSQALTLYTTPVVYLYLDQLRFVFHRDRGRRGNKPKRGRKSGKLALAASALLILGFSLCSCSVGPDYHRPGVLVPGGYKEAEGWKTAEPKDDVIRKKWWEIFGDPQLNALEERLNISNQNIAAAFASFLQARALVKQAQAQYSPVISLNPNITLQNGQTLISSGIVSPPSTFTEYTLPIDASWEPDLWGKVRRTVEANQAGAQMSEADLENERLTEQADLAVDYYELRGQDALETLYDENVAAFRMTLELTRTLSRTGIDTDEAVAQAQTQLESTQAQATSLRLARAQYEHAIALLLGQPASSFSIPPSPFEGIPPDVPLSVPSRLLERRPDVAAAERAMAQANAQIGVATSAYYPDLSLTASAGIEGNSITGLLSAPAFIWSLGASAAQTIFDGGAIRSAVEQYRANYDRAVAVYRQTVLAAFQQVEDDLAGTAILARQATSQGNAVRAARRALKIAFQRFKLGLDPYLNVITAQTAFLSSQQAEATLSVQRMTTSVQLIEALGGGWKSGI